MATVTTEQGLRIERNKTAARQRLQSSNQNRFRCCLCCSTGKCVRCSCVNGKTPCTNCIPGQSGRCSNRPTTDQSSDLLPATPAPNSQPSPPTLLVPSPSSPSIISTSLQQPPFISPDIPDPSPIIEPNFVWGTLDSINFSSSLDAIYDTVVHWKPNLFRVPHGNIGKQFVSELAKMYTAFATSSAMESIAMKATTVIPILLLQKPNTISKGKPETNTQRFNQCLKRRLQSWKDGNLADLLAEGKTIQKRITRATSNKAKENISRSFSNLMFVGKTGAAIRLLSNQSNAGVLRPEDRIGDQSVRDILREKHPSPQMPSPDSLIPDDPEEIHPVLFETIDASLIRSTALRTTGSAGPSGLDALFWRRLCTSYKSASLDLCLALSLVARRLCTEYLDPSLIAPFLSCRLIALNKNPGVRPIGIGDTARRIVAKAILSVIKSDILETTGLIQLCVGQPSGIEAAVHSARSIFHRRHPPC